MRLEGRGNYDIFSRRKSKTVAHFPCVDESAARGHSSLPQQDIRTEVNIAAAFELKINRRLQESQIATQDFTMKLRAFVILKMFTDMGWHKYRPVLGPVKRKQSVKNRKLVNNV